MEADKSRVGENKTKIHTMIQEITIQARQTGRTQKVLQQIIALLDSNDSMTIIAPENKCKKLIDSLGEQGIYVRILAKNEKYYTICKKDKEVKKSF